MRGTLLTEPVVPVSRQELLAAGVEAGRAALILERAGDLLAGGSPSADRTAAEHCWSELSRSLLSADMPFDAHRLLHERIFHDRDPAAGPAPAWLPSVAEVHASNLYALLRARGCATYRELFDWSVAHRMEFWRTMVERLRIRFAQPYSAIADLQDLRAPRWFAGARLNIAESCFGAPPEAPAIIHQAEGGALATVTGAELRALAGRVANGLARRPGTAPATRSPSTCR